MRVAGMGFRAGATLAQLRRTLELAEARGGPVDALATLPARAASAALRQLARSRGLTIHAVSVAGVDTPSRSPRIMALHGTGSVAEAAALVAAGPGATLTLPRLRSPDGMVTCAIAETEGTPA